MNELDMDKDQLVRYVLLKDCQRGPVFYEAADYDRLLCSLARFTAGMACSLHAYALLPDRVEMLTSSPDSRCLTDLLGRVGHDYMQYFNRRHRRVTRRLELGEQLQAPEPDMTLLTYYRYIELAPVRQGLVDHPADYPWSSHAANAMGEDTGLLSPHRAYLALGRNPEARRQVYRELFMTPSGPSWRLREMSACEPLHVSS